MGGGRAAVAAHRGFFGVEESRFVQEGFREADARPEGGGAEIKLWGKASFVPGGDADNSRGQSEGFEPERRPRNRREKRFDPEGVADSTLRCDPFRVGTFPVLVPVPVPGAMLRALARSRWPPAIIFRPFRAPFK